MEKEIPLHFKELLEKASKDFSQKMETVLFTEFNDVDLFIIKSHLLMEHSLNEYIEVRTHKRLEIEKSGFSFSNKLKVGKLLGLFDGSKGEEMEVFFTTLNKLRNQIAHKLTYDKLLLKNLLSFSEFYDEEKFHSIDNYSKYTLEYLVSYYHGMLFVLARHEQLGLYKQLDVLNKLT